MEHHDDEREGPSGYVFAVGERPYCCWDYDHDGRTLEFLDGLDVDYFQVVASTLAEQLESDDPLPVSVALPVNDHQGPAHAIVREQIVREHVDTAESATTDRSAAGGELHTGGQELHADDTITSRHTDEVDDAAQRTLGFERHPGQPGQSW